MRSLLLILSLACIAVADDPFPGKLRVFEQARKKTLKPGGHAQVTPAVEEFVATGDVRAVAPLLQYLADTFHFEASLFDLNKQLQKEGAAAFDRMRDLERELNFLRLKAKAGDETVGPAIEKRVGERRKQERTFERMQQETLRATRAIDFVRRLRDQLAAGAATVLKGLSGKEADAGLVAARRVLDVAKHQQGLYLVIIMRDSALPQVESHLVELMVHPKADDSVVRAAQYALTRGMTKKGAETLLRFWEQEPDGRGKDARHVLSLVARRKLESVKDARGWIATLK